MNEKLSQYGGLFGAAVAAACCLGVTVYSAPWLPSGLAF